MKKSESITSIMWIWNDHDEEFEKSEFKSFQDGHEIQHEFSTPKNLKYNEIVKKKKIVVQEIGRVMLVSKNQARYFQNEIVSTFYYIEPLLPEAWYQEVIT